MLRACLAVLVVLAIGLGLFSTLGTAVAASGDTVTTVLQPGLNLAGWTEAEASVEAIFDAIPELELVYAWDAESQRFGVAFGTDSGLLGDLDTLTPGMGLWLAIAGGEPVTWTRPLVPQTGLAPLHEGWNLVVWAGDDGIATSDALQEIDDLASEAVDANGEPLATLTRGHPFWLHVSAAKQWWQLDEPPQIEFASDYSPEEQQELRGQVDAVVAFYVRRSGVAVPGLTMRFADAEADVVCAGYAARVVYLKEPCIGSIAHEYGHALQEYLATREETGQWGVKETKSPRWLEEGMANHWSALFEEESDVRRFEDYIYTAIENARKTNLQLQDFEDRIDGGLYYNVASLAVARIASLAGEASLVEYYYQRQQHRDWRDNFQEVFGIAVDEFYGLFEEYRADIAPPLPRFRGTVLGPDGQLVEAVRIFAYRPSGGSSSVIGLGPEGYFDGVAPDGSGPHVLSLDFLPGDGSVCHLGWYDGRGGVTTVYSDRAEPFPDGPDIGIRLPATPSELCRRIVGIAAGTDGNPLEGLWVAINGRGASSGANIGAATAADGTFTIGARDGTYVLTIHSDIVGACTIHGYEGPSASNEVMTVDGRSLTGIRLVIAETQRDSPSWTVCGIEQ